MSTDPKEETKDEPVKEADTDTSDSKSATVADVKALLAEAFKDFSPLKSDDKAPEKGDDESDDDKGKPKGGFRSAVEKEARRMIEDAASILKIQESGKAPEAEVTEKIKAPDAPEDNPIKIRKLTKMLWGSGQ